MAKTYRRNSFGRMSWVLYERLVFWQIIALLAVVCGLVVYWIKTVFARFGFDFIILGRFAFWVLFLGSVVFVGLSVVQVSKHWKGLKKVSRLSEYMAELRAIREVEKGLLSAGLVRKIVSETIVQVPACTINAVDRGTILTIEKLPSVSDIDKVAEAVNSSLRSGKFADYAVSEPIETADGLYYHFELHDVNRDLTFCPKEVSDLVPVDPYRFKLMEGVYWHYPSQPMAMFAGLTGSFKTTSLIGCILTQALAVGAEILIIDHKREMIGFKNIIGDNSVVSDPQEVLKVLAAMVKKMEARHEFIGRETSRRGVIGLNGADLGLRPVFIIAEELGALSEAYSPAERKEFHGYLKQLAMLGRSCIYNLVTLLQVPTVESAPAGIKSNTNLKVLLGKSTNEMVTQMFSSGQAGHVSLNPGKFRGWYFLAGETNMPMMFYVPDLHKHKLNTFETFANLYEIGQQRSYND